LSVSPQVVTAVIAFWTGSASADATETPSLFAPAAAEPTTLTALPEVQALPAQPSPHLIQTLAASGFTLAIGTGWYLVDKRNVLDWDKPNLQSRFTGSSWRYDNNEFGMNFLLHPLFGASTYTFARDSHFGVAGSFLTSLLTSLTWEFVVEYNERVSINDVIVTPVAGVALGEFAHKFGNYISNYRKPDTNRKILRWTLSPTTQIARLGCGDELWPAHPTDSLGYASGLWHEFGLSYGLFGFATNQGQSGVVQRFRTSGKLVSLPGYRQPGKSAKAFFDADMTDVHLMVDTSAWGTGVTLESHTTLFGYAAREMSESGNGYAHTIGVSIGYEYRNTTALGLDDRFTFVGFPGAHTDLYWSRRGLTSEVGVRLYPTFGAASVPAFQRYRTQHPNAGFKTIMSREGYFYGWGGTGQVEARQHYGKIHNAILLRAESIWSSQGLDRDQEHVTDDTKAHDLSATAELQTWFDFSQNFVVGIETATKLRESRAGDVRLRLNERSLGLWLGSLF